MKKAGLALGLLLVVVGCSGNMLNPPVGIGTPWPCGLQEQSCGNGGCCGLSEQCGDGITCPVGQCCYVATGDEFELKRKDAGHD